MRFSLNLTVAVLASFLFAAPVAPAAAKPVPFELREGDRVVFLGDTLMEREQSFGWIELMLTTQFPDRNITFRNLGWSADTPAGDSRFGLSLLQAGLEPADEGWTQLTRQLEAAKPTVVFVGYGMASSFDGVAGLTKFKTNYLRLLDTIEKISPGTRFVLLSPLPHQRMPPPFQNPTAHNRDLEAYAKVIREIAESRQLRFVSLMTGFDELSAADEKRRWTDNGIHLNSTGYRAAATAIQQQLGLANSKSAKGWLTENAETLRQAIVRKNQWFFNRSRPENMAYIFGFRKGEQGQNAVEIPKFDALVAAEEKRIAQLRSLQPGVTVPEVPLRTGNLTAKHADQPRPTFEIASGLEVTLWAENPLLDKPIQMNFDPQGRLWVASSEVYPQIEPGQAATDKIIVLEDTTGGGHADKATVFADGLLIPTGVEPGDGGCYVAQSTELLHFKDTDGEGKADVRRTVLSGFGTEDVHHNLHTLRWGFDGRLYMSQSIYTRTDTETPEGVVRLKGGGVFRFDPRNQEMEILFRGWINAWGHQFDDFGESFLTDGAGGEGINFGLPGASYVTAPKARRILGSVSPGSYPKFASLEIIRSLQFPADWQGDMITCDFRAHRIVHFKISEQGAGYITQEMPDVLRSTADSFRPIDVKMGPDGALYVADWSNPIIQHGEVDFRDPRRDKEHGRIWRITAQGRPLLEKTNFTTLNNTELLDRLLSPNGYDREKATRVLVERGAAKVKKDLATWSKNHPDETARMHALWMNEAMNTAATDATARALARELLNAKDGRIRAAAVRAIGNYIETVPHATDLLARMVTDDFPRVRLEAVRALGRIPSARAADLALSVLDKPMDTFLDYGLWLTINELAKPWVAAIKAGEWKTEGHEKQTAFALKSIEPALASEVLAQLIGNRGVPRDGSGPWIEIIGSAGDAKELRQMFDQLVRGEFDEAASLRVLAALNDAARLRGIKPAGELAGFKALLNARSGKLRLAALQLAAAWKIPAFEPELLQIAGATDTPADERAAAFAGLRALGGNAVVKALKKLVRETTSAEVRRDGVMTLASLDFQAALPELPATFKSVTQEADLRDFWRDLLSLKDAGDKLVKELPALGLTPEAARAGVRVAREGNHNGALVQGLMQIAGLSLSEKQLSPAELQAMAQEALAKGDAARGEGIFRRAELACMTCHAIGGAGGKVGPDLTSIGASAPPDYLVESLLYPNAKIKEGYHSTTITTKDGQEFTGIVAKETESEVIMRNAANQQVSIVKSNISQRVTGGSLMPSGLVDALLPEERFDLIKFLSVLGKPGEYDAARGGVARVWKLYQGTSQNSHLGIQGVIKGDFTRADWVTVFSRVNGNLTREICERAVPTREDSRGFFAATQFQSAKGGPAKLDLSGEIKDAWLNGKRITPSTDFTPVLNPGTNTLVLQIDAAKLPAVLKLSSDDVSFVTN